MIKQADINKHVIDIIKKLTQEGFKAYLVGGSVRDLLLGLKPKDFDVVTNAHPDEIRKSFRNCRLIGRRFRLAHIYFRREIIEVATFRGHHASAPEQHTHESGMIRRDNVYGSLDEDAWRRDFSVNALYYDIQKQKIIDHVGGKDDLKQKILRIIGDPKQRYLEDPVRMLRAVRFAAKLNFTIDEETKQPLYEMGDLLENVSSARLFDESVKLFHCGHSNKAYQLLKQFGLFEKLFPQTHQCLDDPHCKTAATLIELTLKNTDARIAHDKPVTPAFIYATLLWHSVGIQTKALQKQGLPLMAAFETAIDIVMRLQRKKTAIPKRITTTMQEIWILQKRLTRRTGKRPFRVLQHPRFRAGYDFLVLRTQAGEAHTALADWWTKFQTATSEEQKAMTKTKHTKSRKKKSKKTKDE